MIPVKDQLNLFRDESTNAIINTDDGRYNEYIMAKNKVIDSQNKILDLEKEIEEIKNILYKLLENK